MAVRGTICRIKVIFAGMIYGIFQFYPRQIVKCCQPFCILTVFLQKKMLSQYQLPLQGILLDFTLTSLPLNSTEVGHIVQWVSKLFPDVPDMSGKFRKCSNCLFILDLDFFQKWWIFLSKNANFCDRLWKAVIINIANDDEWWWNSDM